MTETKLRQRLNNGQTIAAGLVAVAMALGGIAAPRVAAQVGDAGPRTPGTSVPAAGRETNTQDNLVLATQGPGEDIRDQAIEELKTIKGRVLQFANEMPAEKYKWNPGQMLNPPPPDPLADPYGRTVADLFLHMAGTNFTHPPMLGAAPAPGFEAKDYETSTTDKAKVIEQLNKGFDYAIAALSKMNAADLAKTYTIGKQQMTGNAAIFDWIVDLNDYMGQTIAYGRTNGIIGTGPAGFRMRKAGQ